MGKFVAAFLNGCRDGRKGDEYQAAAAQPDHRSSTRKNAGELSSAGGITTC